MSNTCYDEVQKRIFSDLSKVLVVDYVSFKYDNEQFSQGIASILVRFLDKSDTREFSIVLTADKHNIGLEDIESYYAELEFDILKKFSSFLREHSNYIWLHWDMETVKHSFSDIKHRFEKLALKKEEPIPIFGKKNDDSIESISGINFPEIPKNNKIDLNYFLELLYGDDYASDKDKLKELIELNKVRHKEEYLSEEDILKEFKNKNFEAVRASLKFKVDYIAAIPTLIKEKRLKIPKRGFLRRTQAFINHPVVSFVSFSLAFISGLIGVYQVLI